VKKDRTLFFYAFGVWFIFLIVALIDAGFRESFLKPKVGEHLAHVISIIILSSIFFSSNISFYR